MRQCAAGLGLLMCGAVIAYCREHGCKKAEILAINDDGKLEMHEIEQS